jgi:hypothetical protein
MVAYISHRPSVQPTQNHDPKGRASSSKHNIARSTCPWRKFHIRQPSSIENNVCTRLGMTIGLWKYKTKIVPSLYKVSRKLDQVCSHATISIYFSNSLITLLLHLYWLKHQRWHHRPFLPLRHTILTLRCLVGILNRSRTRRA